MDDFGIADARRRPVDLTAQPAFDLQQTLRRFTAAEKALLEPARPPLTDQAIKEAAKEYCRARIAHQQAIELVEKGARLR